MNRVMAIILHYFAEFGSFRGHLRKSGWLATNSFSPDKCRTPTKHDGRAVLFEVPLPLTPWPCMFKHVSRGQTL